VAAKHQYLAAGVMLKCYRLASRKHKHRPVTSEIMSAEEKYLKIVNEESQYRK
jgi:hypothetical protein